MSMGPHNRQNLLVRGADNALPSPHGGDDEFFDVLVLALKEVAGLHRDDVARQSGWEHSDNQDGHFGGRGGRMIVAARR
jgi:hypothetical protein